MKRRCWVMGGVLTALLLPIQKASAATEIYSPPSCVADAAFGPQGVSCPMTAACDYASGDTSVRVGFQTLQPYTNCYIRMKGPGPLGEVWFVSLRCRPAPTQHSVCLTPIERTTLGLALAIPGLTRRATCQATGAMPDLASMMIVDYRSNSADCCY